MPDCCVPGTGCCTPPPDNGTASPICESCGQKGKSVSRLTPASLLKQDAATELQETACRFCATPTCDVVYYANESGQYFHKADLKVRVGLKETEHPVPICYCFDYTTLDVQEEIAATGETDVPGRIRAEVEAGTCRCELENPQGTCCLGNVRRAVKLAMAEAEARGQD